uniref:Uncharacterized protein n=1 Tax=Anguilla anguilla TaxID=7936 RepID=A0A0E9VMJ6_ANGAN
MRHSAVTHSTVNVFVFTYSRLARTVCKVILNVYHQLKWQKILSHPDLISDQSFQSTVSVTVYFKFIKTRLLMNLFLMHGYQ